MVSRYGSIPDVDDGDRRSNTSSLFGSHKTMSYGILLSMLSGVLFTANNFIIKLFNVVVSEAVLVRCVIQIIIFCIHLHWIGERVLPERLSSRFLTCSQGFAGAISFISALASVCLMPIPDALCIIFTSPVFTLILSAIILREKLNCLKIYSCFLLFMGVVLVTQPPFLTHHTTSQLTALSMPWLCHGEHYYVGAALALASCITESLMRVLVTKCEDVCTSIHVIWSAIWGLVISIVYCLIQPDSRILSPMIIIISWREWLLLFGLALSELLAYTFMTHALKQISPNLVSSFRTVELVLAFCVQAVISGQLPDLWTCLGGLLVLAGVLVNAFEEKLTSMSESTFSYVSFASVDTSIDVASRSVG